MVPRDSKERVISAEALYYLYGFGADKPEHQVPPWTDPSVIIAPSIGSRVGKLLAKAVGLPLERPFAVPPYVGDAGYINALGALAGTPRVQGGIGFQDANSVAVNRDQVNELAYQAPGQHSGYWPSATASSSDRINVREGRYDLWNPFFFYARADAQGEPEAAAQPWFDLLTGAQPLPDGKSLLDVQIAAGLIPDCAMRVQRSGDLGPLASFLPDVSCGCYFEAHSPFASAEPGSGCQPCSSDGAELALEAPDSDCPQDTPYCRYGFCEVR
jgi:hypothetical protein